MKATKKGMIKNYHLETVKVKLKRMLANKNLLFQKMTVEYSLNQNKVKRKGMNHRIIRNKKYKKLKNNFVSKRNRKDKNYWSY